MDFNVEYTIIYEYLYIHAFDTKDTTNPVIDH